ncbi:MAG: DMT family transporter [Roseovarius sp.]
MSTTATTPPQSNRAAAGILCVEAGMVFFVIQDVLMKTLLETHPVWNLIIVRSLVTLLLLTPVIFWLRGAHRILTPLWPLHLARAALLAAGFTLFYAAFPLMGLAEVTTIFFSAPLMTALLAALVLRETIGIHRIGALVVGFIGVIIAMNPTEFDWVTILPLTCALTYAISQIIARQIGERESPLTMGLQTITYMGLMMLPLAWLVNTVLPIGPEFPHMRLDLPEETWRDLPQLLMLGVAGMIGWMLVSRAYQIANASLVAPFDYTYLPIAVLLGWLLFDEVPPFATIIGMMLIIASGLYVGFRELRAARKNDDDTVIAEATFAPGAAIQPLEEPPEREAP